MIDIIRLYQDFGLQYQSAGGRGVGRGWVGIPCPFCTGNPGYHLGFCIDPYSKYYGKFSCWRCGGKSAKKVISRITNISENEVYSVIKKYSTDSKILLPEEKKIVRAKQCKLPSGTTKMKNRHKNYLRKRGFDPEYLEKFWKIQGTGPVGSYKHRIIIPIYFQETLVSYQGRDITDKSNTKYKACPQELEIREHKHCLYGIDLVKSDSIIVCEGVTDVWRLGAGAVATFGIKFTPAQARLLINYKNVFILYDTDSEAVEQADNLSNYLSAYNINCEIIELKTGDPADLSDKEAKELMSDLIRN